jgi:1-deoxy-D-xylulose-5-phosphate synthase
LNNVCSTITSRLIIIVNDNGYSIQKNVGGVHNHLKNLSEAFAKDPQSPILQNNLFTSLGLKYLYEPNGNDINSCIKSLSKAKNLSDKSPVVLHIKTTKGNSIEYMESNPHMWHFSATGFNLIDGKKEIPADNITNYSKIGHKIIAKKLDDNPKSMIVVPGNPILGYDFQTKYPDQYIDVSIAEAHAVSFSSGVAKGFQLLKTKARVYCIIEDYFVQRAYSQLLSDLAINNNPVTIILQGAGLNPLDAAHGGQFDIPLISHIPNIVYLSPTTAYEYSQMIDWAETYNGPVLIRISRGISEFNDRITPNLELGKWEVVKQGTDVAIIGLGILFDLANNVAKQLNDSKVSTTLINPRFINQLDYELLDKLKKTHRVIVTLESGVLSHGFGKEISAYLCNDDIKVLNFGGKTEFTDWEPLDKLFKDNGITVDNIVKSVLSLKS